MNNPDPAEEARAYLQSIVDTVREPLIVLDAALRVVSASRSFYRVFHVTPPEVEGNLLYALGNGQWDIPALRRLLEQILALDSAFDDYEVTHDFPHLGQRTMLLNARRIRRPASAASDRTETLLLAMEDVTERRAAEGALRAALAREKHITEALQRPLTQEIREDAFPGLSVATLYAPALAEAEVGGDFFDAFSLGGDRVALAVGDVMGKGLLAAALAGRVKDVLRAFLRENHDPAHTLSRLNEYLCDTMSGVAGITPFVVLSLAVLDSGTGAMRFSSAGAEPPLVLRGSGDAVAVEAGQAPLGMWRDGQYADTPLHLAPGDVMLLATDGITEARRESQFLGFEGMLEIARQNVSAPSIREMGEAVLAGARAFGGPFRDDVCLLLARRR